MNKYFWDGQLDINMIYYDYINKHEMQKSTKQLTIKDKLLRMSCIQNLE